MQVDLQGLKIRRLQKERERKEKEKKRKKERKLEIKSRARPGGRVEDGRIKIE